MVYSSSSRIPTGLASNTLAEEEDEEGDDEADEGAGGGVNAAIKSGPLFSLPDPKAIKATGVDPLKKGSNLKGIRSSAKSSQVNNHRNVGLLCGKLCANIRDCCEYGSHP
jgi:hypothetical protein